ncbi:hypothetical protein NQ317_007445 [Molorchus minor]|uniref:Uncharacterized protein n=1 Tax=Molorchus minor TaxID=1323400 RepID=A0ABQ9JH42_9CUCU|nr:hypothetical protein NQ317_007445 [Molorchus minor]
MPQKVKESESNENTAHTDQSLSRETEAQLPSLPNKQNVHGSNSQSQSLSITNYNSEPYIFLSTATVYVLDRHGNGHLCRVLLDNCS